LYYLADNIADNVSLGMGSITLEKYAHLRYLYDDESDDIRVQQVCGKIVTASADGEDISGVSLGLKIVFSKGSTNYWQLGFGPNSKARSSKRLEW
jgi:hypothetical protein